MNPPVIAPLAPASLELGNVWHTPASADSELAPMAGVTSAERRPQVRREAISLRPARATDVPDILAMIRELAAFENLEDELEVTAASLEESLFGPHPAAASIVALVGPQAVGYAIYYHTFSSFVGRPGIFLDDIYVRPAHRQQGIGRALLERVAQIGTERRCARFEWIALRWNENALRFYKSVGAHDLDEWVLLRMGGRCMRELAEGAGL